MNVEYLAEELHKTYRAACKANHAHSGKHDHGWQNCQSKDYFRRRAEAIIVCRALYRTLSDEA